MVGFLTVFWLTHFLVLPFVAMDLTVNLLAVLVALSVDATIFLGVSFAGVVVFFPG